MREIRNVLTTMLTTLSQTLGLWHAERIRDLRTLPHVTVSCVTTAYLGGFLREKSEFHIMFQHGDTS